MAERPVRSLGWLLAWAWLALCACGNESHAPGFGGETNWLRACDEDGDCYVGSCLCGLCSDACGDDVECPSGLRCERQNSALYTNACGVDLEVHGLCAPTCDGEAECGSGLACSEGACAPTGYASSGDGGPSPSGQDGAASESRLQLVVDAHLDRTLDCAPDLERPIGSGTGMFDIAGSEHNDPFSGGPTCSKPYVLALRVQNLLPDDVLMTEVKVLLMSTAGETIVFSQTEPSLPNPFTLSVSGSVPAAVNGEPRIDVIVAEVIPEDYAQQLEMFVGGQIAIRAQLVGQTIAGERVQANAFDYRVPLCYGCLIECMSSVEERALTVEDFVGGACDDGAGADGRYCIDPDC